LSKNLFKYRTWLNEYDRKCFIEREVYFSNNFTFNDPYDLNLPVRIKGSRPFSPDAIQNTLRNKFGGQLTSLGLEQAKKIWEGELMEEMIPELRENIEKVSKSLAEKFGILCLSKSSSSPLMWGHYANSHNGFCLGLNQNKLHNYLKEKFGERYDMFPVKYQKEVPQIDISPEKVSKEHFLPIAKERKSVKYYHWKYEREVRIIINDFSRQSLKLPADIFDTLIYGLKMDKTDIKVMQLVANKVYPNIKIYKAELSSNKFAVIHKEYSA